LSGRLSLVELLKRDALRLGTFTLASGRTSHYYVDGRTVTLSSEGAFEVGRGVLERLRDWPDVDAVGGLSLGADPIVGATLALAGEFGRAGLLGFLVRKEAQSHGTARLVEGPIRAGMNVVVLDDVVTSGASSLKAVDAALELGCQVRGVIAMLDRLEGAAAAFAGRGLPFRSLCTIRELGVEPLDPSRSDS
jgi:orotate phosphoribosyltransferase